MSHIPPTLQEIRIDQLVQDVDDEYRQGILDFWADRHVQYLVVYFSDEAPEERELVTVGQGLEFDTLEEAGQATVEGKPARLYVRSRKYQPEPRKPAKAPPRASATTPGISTEDLQRMEKAAADLEARLKLLKQNEQDLMTRVQELMVSEMKETRKKIERKKLEEWSKQLEERESSLAQREDSLVNFQKATQDKAAVESQDVSVLQERLKHKEEQLRRQEEELTRKLESLKGREEELAAREQYVENSEETLIDKAQANFEMRAELEQKEEDLNRREATLLAREGEMLGA